LPNATLDQKIATGFHRCNVTTNEAGIIPEEFQAIYDKDRADTTGAVWLGMTVGCATCHDHKFDPISQKDFYALTAFFKNTTQPVMDGNIYDPPPMLVVPREEDRAAWAKAQKSEADLRQEMSSARKAEAAAFDSWLAAPERAAVKMPVTGDHQVVSVVPAQIHPAKGVTLGGGPTANRKALHFGKKAVQTLPAYPFDADKPFSISMWIYMPKSDESVILASQFNYREDEKEDDKEKGRGMSIDVGGRVPGMRLTGDDGKAISVRAGHLDQLKTGTWNHLAFSYDGSRETEGLAIYVNGGSIVSQGGDENRRLRGSISAGVPLQLGGLGKRFFDGGAIADFRIYNHALNEDEARLTALWPMLEDARKKPAAALTADEKAGFQVYWLLNRDRAYRQLTTQLASLMTEKRAIRRRGAVTLVQNERTDGKPMSHILYRGAYDQPRAEVEPATPSVLPPMAPSLPRDRMGLAKWLVDNGNPMTARVTVNRFWQEVFGTGIVKTVEDFGTQGEQPSNQQLLDWMAVEFRESGWDVKKFYRMMVTSATYRQAALATEEKLQKDPDNRLLSRGPRFRMDGEMVRDYALAVSGLLTPTIGGPSVRPYQPQGVWEAVAMVGSNTRFYKPDHGGALYRRSMYTFWKRSAPPASMDIFNAPTRETCTVRRERTNTPLQALVTMNDPQFVEAARKLAETSLRSAPANLDRQFDFMAWQLLARPFIDKERTIARQEYRDYLNFYDSHPTDANKLLATGESAVEKTLSPAELAAMTMVANQVLNLDEVLTK